MPPLGRHGGQPQLEEVAFQLQEGQLSGIIQVGDKFVILRCEGRTERIDVDESEVRDMLYRDIYEKKLRMAMSAEVRGDQRPGAGRQLPRRHVARAGRSRRRRAGQAGVRQDTAVRPTAGAR